MSGHPAECLCPECRAARTAAGYDEAALVAAEEARAFAADMNDPRGDEPEDVNFDGHLRWLETGEGEAWPRKTGKR